MLYEYYNAEERIKVYSQTYMVRNRLKLMAFFFHHERNITIGFGLAGVGVSSDGKALDSHAIQCLYAGNGQESHIGRNFMPCVVLKKSDIKFVVNDTGTSQMHIEPI